MSMFEAFGADQQNFQICTFHLSMQEEEGKTVRNKECKYVAEEGKFHLIKSKFTKVIKPEEFHKVARNETASTLSMVGKKKTTRILLMLFKSPITITFFLPEKNPCINVATKDAF